MLLDGSDQGPPTAVYTDNAGFPFPPRTLSRISEGSSKPDAPMCSRSGSEGGPDTITDQNCTTTSDGDPDNNPPSLNSDLPENLEAHCRATGGAVMRAIAQIEGRNFGLDTLKDSSKDLPSPPSSMINTTTEEVTQEGKTEVTLVDSLYLELSPAGEDCF